MRHHRERRAVALQAGHVEVAARLVDPRLAAVWRVDRLDGQAVALVAAVAAPLAHALVDDDAEGRLGDQPAAAGTPLLGGALLVVQQHGHARHGGQLDLRLDQAGAVPHVDLPCGQRAEVGVLPASGSSDVTTTRLTPSSSSDWTTSGTVIWPCGSCPPVIATVPL